MASTSQGDLTNTSTSNRSRNNPKEGRMPRMEEESLPNHLTVRCNSNMNILPHTGTIVKLLPHSLNNVAFF